MHLTSEKITLQVIEGDIVEFETIPPERHYSYYANFSESETELIDLEIQKLLQKEVIVPSIPEKTELVSPIFTVPKPDGGITLILNLRN